MLSRTKLVREFPGFKRSPGGKNHVQKNLESLTGHLTHSLLKHVSPNGEKTTHRVGEFGFARQRTQICRKAADKNAGLRPISHTTTLTGIASSDGQLEIRILLKSRQHFRQNSFIVLEVTIHHCKNICCTRSHPLQTRRSQTSPTNPTNKTHIRLCSRQVHQNLKRTITGVIINKDRLPFAIDQKGFQPLDHDRYILPLVVGRDDD